VETHANVISGLLDGKIFVKPDYAVGFEVVILVLAGLVWRSRCRCCPRPAPWRPACGCHRLLVG
jgi:hypothetical protein